MRLSQIAEAGKMDLLLLVGDIARHAVLKVSIIRSQTSTSPINESQWS